VLYCFDTNGVLQSVFTDDQGNPATSIDTNQFGVTGIAFSTNDYNLWHVTDARTDDPGHSYGAEAPPDFALGRKDPIFNTSYYFGLEDPRLPTTISNQPGAFDYSTNPAISGYRNYN